MKYSSSNKPLVCMQTQSTCYENTTTITPLGVLWHSTAANNPSLKRYVQPSDKRPPEDTYSKEQWLQVLGTNTYKNDWNHIYREAGLNCWIGKLADGTVTTVQTMPWNFKPWGCGSGSKGSCNNGWLQFEICEDDLTNKDYFNAVYKEACEITAYLCKMFNLDPKGTVQYNGVTVPVILCHKDSYNLGLGSNHGDVYHWFNKYGKTMDDVRNDVAALLNVEPTQGIEYKVVTTIKTYSSAANAKAQKDSVGTYAPGTYYIYNKYPNGLDGMFNISKNNTGASAGSWINPVENVLPKVELTAGAKITLTNAPLYTSATNATKAKDVTGTYYIWSAEVINNRVRITTQEAKVGVAGQVTGWVNVSDTGLTESVGGGETTTPKDNLYRVRKSKDDSKSQVGAYSNLQNAIEACQKAGPGYHVFDGDYNIVYSYKEPEVETKPEPEKPVEPEKPEEPVNVPAYELNYPVKTPIITSVQDDYKVECVKAIKKIVSNYADFNVEIAKTFFELAPRYRIDPMMAISQSILETGWFKFAGSSVKPEQNNFCGLGATGGGVAGNSFATIGEGITAQLQHLYAYGCKDALPDNEEIIDPRFSKVSRGVAPYWQQLAGRWATPGYDATKYKTSEDAMKDEATYGQKILKIKNQLDAVAVYAEDIEKYFPTEVEPEPEIPDEPTTPEEPIPSPEDKPDYSEDRENVSVILKLLRKLLEFFTNLFGLNKEDK